MPSIPDRRLSVYSKPRSPETLASKIRKFPPASPLPRAVHGPQRNMKFSGSSVRRPQQEVRRVLEEEQGSGKMGSSTTMVESWARLKKAKAEAFGFFRWLGKVRTVPNAGNRHPMEANENVEGLSVEEYKKRVDGVVSDQASRDACLEEPTTTSHFRPSSSIVSFDAGKMIDSSRVNIVEESLRRPPLYKEPYESSRKQNSTLSVLDFEVRLAQRKLSALKLIHREEEVVPCGPFTPLTDEEEVHVSNALCGSNRQELLVAHESSNIEITREVLQGLKPGAWLNDEVINLYLELLKERERRDPKKFLKCHFLNTFFYKKLTGGKNGYDYNAVRRWTTQKRIGCSLIECDKIFIPIHHKEIHWCLAVINIKDEKFQYLDSLKGMDTQVLKVLSGYFVDEVKDKNNRDIQVKSWKQEFVADLPEQMNGCDCGMFMIKYADFYSRGLELSFSQEHMPYFRKRTVKEILKLRAE